MTSGTPADRREDGPDAASEPVTHALPSAADRRLLRERAGLTRAQAAARLGVSAQTLRAWERGRSRPHGRRLEAYAGLLTELTREGAGAGAVDVPRPVTTTPPADAPDPVTATPPAEIPHPVEATPPADFPRPVTAPPTTPGITHATQATTTAQAALAPLTALTPPATEPLPLPGPPETAFATLYARAAPGLLREAYLLTSRPRVALAAVLILFLCRRGSGGRRWRAIRTRRGGCGWWSTNRRSRRGVFFCGRGRTAAPADAGAGGARGGAAAPAAPASQGGAAVRWAWGSTCPRRRPRSRRAPGRRRTACSTPASP
ncbi:helix-turn-helix domain-containing protein [Streptomyces sp. SPB78]|uniref:helix-turn-helix domain-containing protein n=1 Tax=Streptomyces sp. (strain SPB78) TaxID=591157 RepID=UPI001F2839BF|nr:helix-turn-helix transcriptional regulator [Streptomyces sp. SPB78]